MIDGARPDTLQKLVNQSQLPNIKKHLFDEGSFTVGTTCLPSTTGPAYLPFLTGVHPGEHHITGIRWFDKAAYFRTNRWHKSATRSYCGYEAKYFNEDMDPDFPSLFEIYPEGVNLYNMVTKGVKEENDITKKGKTGLYFRAHFYHEHHQVDQAGRAKLMASLKKDSPFTFTVFPSIDWDSHTYHYESPQTIEAYKIVDETLAELTHALGQKGDLNDSLIVMASDHGLTDTHSHLDLGKYFKSHNYSVLEYPNFMTPNPKIAIFISGNSFATLSFLDEHNLYFGPDLRRNHESILQDFVEQTAIDFISYRESEHEITIMNKDGLALIRIQGEKLSYIPKTADPLALAKEHLDLDSKQCFDMSYESKYPDSLFQIVQLMKSHRSGDVCVYAERGHDLRDFWEIPEHKGSHGSLHREHMHVPILTNQHQHIPNPVRTTHIYSVIKSWLNN